MITRIIDQQYYEVAKPGSVAEAVLKKARARIYADFIRRTAPDATSTILDVGVSDVHTDGANWLEVQYPHKAKLSACGLGEALEFRTTFPDVSYTKIAPNKPLPFADDQFNIATSNAVLEHVGSRANQAQFVNELVRVARRIFISVPHRYFPVEHHTGIPGLHYFDWSFRAVCRALGKSKWTEPENLILMTRTSLQRLARKAALSAIPAFGSDLFRPIFLWSTRSPWGGMRDRRRTA